VSPELLQIFKVSLHCITGKRRKVKERRRSRKRTRGISQVKGSIFCRRGRRG